MCCSTPYSTRSHYNAPQKVGVADGALKDNQLYLEAQGSTVTAKYGYGNALIHRDGEYPLFDG